MAVFRCLSSGSHGNAYIIECENETLLIELGIGWKDILQGLNYDLSKICGCLVTHQHKDHSKSIPNALKSGISIYSCQEVANIYKPVKVLPIGGEYTAIGNFKVMRLALTHNCECIGFIIRHNEFGKMLFCTDCASMTYWVKDCNHIMIEANYSYDKMIDNMCNNIEILSASENHMEINQTIDAIKHNYSPQLMNIVLLHLSSGNSDETEFVKRVKDEIGFNDVYVATKGLKVELNKTEF